jgi:hypothetical protein
VAESEIVCVTISPFPRSQLAHGRAFSPAALGRLSSIFTILSIARQREMLVAVVLGERKDGAFGVSTSE